MPTQLQLRRGSNSDMSSFTGAEGELTVNTTNKSLHLHDGSTSGGIEFARADLSNSTASWTVSDGTNTSTIVVGTDTLTVNGTSNQIDVAVGTDSVTISTPDSGVTAASYGSSTAIPVVTVDAKGRVTAVTTASITAGAADTDELSEGSTNLYFTNSRADARITNALKDEDNMASDSATHVPSQQSVKAYVDAQTTDETAEGSSNLYYTDARVSTRTDTILNHSNHTNVTVSKVGDELRLSAASSYGDSDVGSYLSSNDFATQTAIVAAITDSAPSTLDTLNELAAALGDDENFSATTATALGLRVSKTADTGAAIMPAGTTAQRPTPAAGHVRYNSDLEQIEAYTDAWVPLGGASTVNADTFTGNGSTTAYALSQTVSSEDNLLVFIEGVFQQQDAYSIATASGTTTLTFSAAPSNTNTILVYSFASNIQGSNLNIDTMTGDGSDVTLSLSIAPVNENNTQVFIDGVYQNKSGYSISGSTLTFSTAPPNGSAVEVMTMTQTQVNVPVDGTITSAKLSGDLTTPGALTVTGAATMDGLTVGDTSASQSLIQMLANPTNGANTIHFGDGASSDAYVGYINYAHDSNSMQFSAAGSERMRIDSTGNLLLGTNSVIGGAGGSGAQIFLKQAASSNGVSSVANSNNNYVRMLHTGTTGKVETTYGTDGSYTPLTFFTSGAERLRIDSSGNVLVGKTTSGTANTGAELRSGVSNHAVVATSTSETPVVVNRKTNDGSLINLLKDGTTVGSIASISNDLVIYSSTASHAGLSFGNTRIEPTNNQGVIYNGGIDLGNTDSRFKDIYLAGGAYLGGTGAANKLEDYEEGTWTPTISAVGGGTVSGISLNEAYYTKIGRQVNFYLYLSAINLAQLTTGTYVILSGLPFASSAYSDFNFTYMRGGTTIRGGYIQSGQSYIYLCDSSGAESQQSSNHLLTAFIGAGSYMTNA